MNVSWLGAGVVVMVLVKVCVGMDVGVLVEVGTKVDVTVAVGVFVEVGGTGVLDGSGVGVSV